MMTCVFLIIFIYTSYTKPEIKQCESDEIKAHLYLNFAKGPSPHCSLIGSQTWVGHVLK